MIRNVRCDKLDCFAWQLSIVKVTEGDISSWSRITEDEWWILQLKCMQSHRDIFRVAWNKTHEQKAQRFLPIPIQIRKTYRCHCQREAHLNRDLASVWATDFDSMLWCIYIPNCPHPSCVTCPIFMRTAGAAVPLCSSWACCPGAPVTKRPCPINVTSTVDQAQHKFYRSKPDSTFWGSFGPILTAFDSLGATEGLDPLK